MRVVPRVLWGAGDAAGGALDQLAYWAPMPMLVAMSMMAGEAGQHPTVRAYLLRSLYACLPEQVRGRSATHSACIHQSRQTAPF